MRLELGLTLACLGLGCDTLLFSDPVPECTPTEGALPSDSANIVLILTDDQTAESVEHMPSVKELLVREGVTFRNAFATTPICCPSRASMLTGQYAHNHGVLSNRRVEGGWPTFKASGAEESTIATWLQNAGYSTGLVGKYLNLYPENDGSIVPPGWTTFVGLHTGAEGTDYYNYRINENGRVRSWTRDGRGYQTDVMAAYARRSITKLSSAGHPFFLVVSVFAPHLPSTPAPRHVGMSGEILLQTPESFNEADVSDKPHWVRTKPRLSSGLVSYLRRVRQRRIESLQAVDEMVRSLIETLDEHDILRNTYVFFSSDNGIHAGEHRFLSVKNTAYEEAIRVPLIIRGPGIPSNCKRDHIALNIDLAPTIAAIGKVQMPKETDGRSLLSVLGTVPPMRTQWRQAFMVENWWRNDGASFETYALRTTSHSYIEWSTGEREFYDLEQDQYQLESLHATAEPALLDRYSSWLEELMSCAGPTCRQIEERWPSLSKHE